MNILMVGSHFSDSFHNTNAWQELADQLTSRGHDVLTTSGKNNKILRMSDMLYTIWSKRDQYQVAQVDVFSGQAFIWAYLSGKLLNFINKPFILTLRGGKLPVFATKHPGAVSWLLSRASAVTAPSAYLAEKMKKFREDIIIIPNGIDLDHYLFLARSSPKPNLIWLRAFHEIYNPLMAVEVLGQLIHTYPDATLTMIGPDKGDNSLQRAQKRATELNIEHAIQFVGRVPKSDVARWLNTGDIFINTTNYDNTPISVMEAMACGLCVVSTNVGGIPNLIDDGISALLVNPGNSTEMTSKIIFIIKNSEAALEISINANNKMKFYDWKKIVPNMESLFTQVCDY